MKIIPSACAKKECFVLKKETLFDVKADYWTAQSPMRHVIPWHLNEVSIRASAVHESPFSENSVIP